MKEKKNKASLVDRILFVGFALIIIIFICIAIFAMNVANIKDILVERVADNFVSDHSVSSEDSSDTKKIKAYEEHLNNELDKLAKQEAELSKLKQQLQSERFTLEEEKSALAKREQEINGTAGDVKKIVKVVEKMDPESAAKMLTNMKDIQMIKGIVFQLKDSQAAAILDNLSPQLAADITTGKFNDGIDD